ncbi:DUF5592 family protein [Bacillus sp. UNCCL81]|uniref:DUF5592 family protein n=1 Tax=Bacillus sp. UNCCL81 TaxID=1502755 RepID=UPI0008F437B8|nr:DUF5592 family protein [Bacillus sp. UNCCL81]QKE76049.1 hypothetical protein HPK19_24900 [Arthrobacter citreus]SFD59961.1 hypothetical protein SAMN02799633_04227 [Bacillus sp. UNCCL81]
MANYRIPKEVTSELKINKAIYLFDLFFIMGLLLGAMVLGNLVITSLKQFFYVFVGIVGLVFILRPYTNPQKRMYQAVLIAASRKKETYCAIDDPTNERNENQ